MDGNRFDRFEEYLSGSMSQEEKALLEAALLSDEEQSTEFEVYCAIETEMRDHYKNNAQEKALKASLQTRNTRYFQSDQQPPNGNPAAPQKALQNYGGYCGCHHACFYGPGSLNPARGKKLF